MTNLIKSSIAIVVFLIAVSCQKEQAKKFTFYQAVKGKDTALLRLSQFDNRFYGQLEIRYGGVGKDSGEVRGVKIQDTLKGKFDYRSYGGSKKWVPFVLLHQGNAFKMGSGVSATFMNMPLFLPGTLQFDESDFQFKPISIDTATKLGLEKE